MNRRIEAAEVVDHFALEQQAGAATAENFAAGTIR